MSDIIVIGGSIMGSSFAYHMGMAGEAGAVTVIEPDSGYEFSAAPRSAGGVRLMHGLRENVEMSQYGQEVYRNFARLMDVDGEPGTFSFRELGYLHLVSGAKAAADIEANCELQNSLGAKNVLLTPDEVKAKWPLIHTDDLDLALHGPDDGFIDPYAAVVGFRRKAESLGVKYLKDRVVAISTSDGKATGVTLESGRELKADVIVNVAGAWAPEVCAMVGMKLPVEPRFRATFYFEAEDDVGPMPLTKDSGEASIRTEGKGFATVLAMPEDKGGFRWDVTQSDHYLFEERRWPAIAHRFPVFERIKVVRTWPGHYAVNWMDGNTIIGSWIGELENFIVATGFTGAGLQKGPAIGRALSELVLKGRYETIDLSRLSYQRVLDDAPLRETGFSA